MDTELNRNGLPTIKYNLGPDTARTVTNIICANNVSNSNSNHERTPIIIQTKQHGAGAANPPVSMSKYGKDTAKHIQRTNQDDIFNPSDNSVIHLDNKKQRIALPNTPIPTTVVQNIPFFKPQFVLQRTSSEQNLRDATNKTQHTMSTLRSSNESLDSNPFNYPHLGEPLEHSRSESDESIESLKLPSNFPHFDPLELSYVTPSDSLSLTHPPWNIDSPQDHRPDINTTESTCSHSPRTCLCHCPSIPYYEHESD